MGLLVGGKSIDNPVDGLGRARRMQSTKHQMAGFGCRERQRNRLIIAHFAEQNNIRVFAQSALQGRGKTLRIATDFALRNNRINFGMHKFNRVFDGDNMLAALSVNLIDQRGERGRFTRPGGPGHQHHAFFLF